MGTSIFSHWILPLHNKTTDKGTNYSVPLSVILLFTLFLRLLCFLLAFLGPVKVPGPVKIYAQVPSRFMRKIVCRLRLNEVSRQGPVKIYAQIYLQAPAE